MSLLAVKDLSLTLGQPLFTDLSLTLAPGDRLGLVAANGRGKSSLLACLAGQAEPTTGEITRSRGLVIRLVPQEVPAELLALTLRAAVAGGLADRDEDWRVDIALDDLAVPGDLRDRPLAALSGGWQRSALLARAAVAEPDLYLMDEPTNHLDLSRIGLLQDWLAALPRETGVILTSHDRAFLDAVTTRTLFLRESASRGFALPYTRARAALDEADAADARRFENDLARAGQLRRQAAKLKNIGINSGSDLLVVKTKQLTERAEKIEAAARPAARDRSAGAIRLSASDAHARALLTLDEAEVRAPDGRRLFRSGKLWIGPGERVVLLGPNGAGKTQLVRAVLAAHAARETGGGAIRAAAAMRLGHSDQMLAQLPPKATPFALVSARTSADAAARSLLAGAGIRPDWQGRPVLALSGGQKARLALLLLRLERPNFYLLDEPTNHLDIEGQEALEEELRAQGAACLLVSHDRAFIRATGSRFWQITGGRLVEVEGPEAFFRAEEARR
ncbi:ATP-binding cassette domain-containing protein [Pseudogemmobacter blasticus]|uniref:ABC transporter n=1 Tax=Fuscovulum blasticum DSM 2131 TaxID=1188250 RepID=A0A2T4J8U3_FUSBL|nr:ATP-binding cassette domain-containing protein [Fuscovulum blasticum]PTE14248.1 ABC transporter [Fuscovulum blasticum DSM 2131]